MKKYNITKDHIPHAILIESEIDSAALDFAFYIAKLALCSDDKNSPCDQCSNCFKNNRKIHPDVKLYEPSGASDSFGIDLIRNIRQDAYILPNEAEHKIYILKNADNITLAAQNALLKVLEEPPETVIFILILKSASSLLDTVRSRVTIFSLGEELHIEEKNINFIVDDILEAIKEKSDAKLFSASSKIKNTQEAKLILKILVKKLHSFYHDNLNNTMHMIELINKSIVLLNRNVNTSLVLTKLFGDLCEIK